MIVIDKMLTFAWFWLELSRRIKIVSSRPMFQSIKADENNLF